MSKPNETKATQAKTEDKLDVSIRKRGRPKKLNSLEPDIESATANAEVLIDTCSNGVNTLE